MNRIIKIVSCLFVLLLLSLPSYAAVITYTGTPVVQKDTAASDKALKKMANKEAHKAAIMSTICPGLGQAYNKKYWKMPIIYAALAGMGYLVYHTNYLYQEYHKELLLRYKYGDSLSVYTLHNPDPKLAVYSTTDLNTQKLLYQKHFDFTVIGLGAVYLLNIVDASIDGHLKTFDVSDNLSLIIKPKAIYCMQSPFGIGAGISITLAFKK